jgi:hypothetical protein
MNTQTDHDNDDHLELHDPPMLPEGMKWGSPEAEEFFQKLIWRDLSPKPAPQGDTNNKDEG